MKTYKVSEIYDTIQGEGSLAGTPMTFIRLAGCDVGCSFCDQKESWGGGQNMTVNEICGKVVQGWVCITGGEPVQQELGELVVSLFRQGRKIALETSGVSSFYPLVPMLDWICVSPKKGYLAETLDFANEIKYLVQSQLDIITLQRTIPTHLKNKVWLQPVSQSEYATEVCISACLRYGYRLSVQVHKYIGIN